MAIYESKLYSTSQETHLKERYIYGVERHGHIREHIEVYNNGVVAPSSDPYVENTLGKKRYELKSYNDNVHVVITDRKTYNDSEDVFEAVDVQKSDYYAFGMSMPGRSIYNEPIRFGYHGMEMDSEHKGDGNHYTTYFRQYDPRLGRWMSLDPESAMFPFESNYAANHNNPVMFVDSEGDSPILAGLVIAIGTDFIMQFTKGIIGNSRKYGFWKAVGYSWNNIDFADVLISGLVGMALPGLGIYRQGLDLATKQLRKRIVKYTGKILMNMIDFKYIEGKLTEKKRIHFSLTFFKWGVGTNDGRDIKSREDRWRDRVLTTIGIAIQEFDFMLEWFSFGLGSLINDGKLLKNTSFSTIAYSSKGHEEEFYYGFQLANQIWSWISQQLFEGLSKGAMYPDVGEWAKKNFPNPVDSPKQKVSIEIEHESIHIPLGESCKSECYDGDQDINE